MLAIPHKRTERNLVTYLTEPEVDALLAGCDQTTWTGRRDHAMFALTIQAGLRISELAALTCEDVTLSTGANVHCRRQGKKGKTHAAGARHPEGYSRPGKRSAMAPRPIRCFRRPPQGTSAATRSNGASRAT
ncbi:MAG: tyrosine-type recombinase/integrase [Actinobacteria bacterium]|nr:tyrosine-type recombinase/integrase [Actinomycetota bacterium]